LKIRGCNWRVRHTRRNEAVSTLEERMDGWMDGWMRLFTVEYSILPDLGASVRARCVPFESSMHGAETLGVTMACCTLRRDATAVTRLARSLPL
jgi:hypothetical protein